MNGTLRMWSVIAGVGVSFAVVCRPSHAQELRFVDVMTQVGTTTDFDWCSYHDNIVVADWDGDGDLDILVVPSPNVKPHPGGLAFVNLLKETGKLRFENRTAAVFPSGANRHLQADGAPVFFDIDADGDLDICSITDEGDRYTLINDGKGVFKVEWWGFSASDMTIRDFDGDGRLDVRGNDTSTIYRNEDWGHFSDGARPIVHGGLSFAGKHGLQHRILCPRGLKVPADIYAPFLDKPPTQLSWHWSEMDFNGDGRPDWIFSISVPYGGEWTRYYASTNGGYEDVTAKTGLPGRVVRWFDVNSDGEPDAFVSAGGKSGLYLNQKGHFVPAAELGGVREMLAEASGGCQTSPKDIVDLNNDGILDIVAYQYRACGGSKIYVGTGRTTWKLVQPIGAGSGQVVADLDQDGLLEIVSSGDGTGKQSRGVHVLKNAGKSLGHWLEVKLVGGGNNPFAAASRVETYEAGKLGRREGMMGWGEVASDGNPVHFGLGGVGKIDVRVTFHPLGTMVEKKGVDADRMLVVEEPAPRTPVTPDPWLKPAPPLFANSQQGGGNKAVFEDTFDGPVHWRVRTPRAWSIAEDPQTKSKALCLIFAVGERASLEVVKPKDFRLTFNARSGMIPEDKHWPLRDFFVHFGTKDPKNGYAVAFNGTAEYSGIYVVAGGVEKRIAAPPENVVLIDAGYHEYVIERKGKAILVLLDGRKAMEARDATFGEGEIGFGSRNDPAWFDDVKLELTD
jgi:hypothetical protein